MASKVMFRDLDKIKRDPLRHLRSVIQNTTGGILALNQEGQVVVPLSVRRVLSQQCLANLAEVFSSQNFRSLTKEDREEIKKLSSFFKSNKFSLGFLGQMREEDFEFYEISFVEREVKIAQERVFSYQNLVFGISKPQDYSALVECATGRLAILKKDE